ncbi:superoxide dismutase family protein [Streptomyces sp. NPDC017993]|uniref:superoxide dismutase family protein n=1 Tax=Streptomyces sp. NPDC017993 TaxID=3365027 RepID=UPI00378B6286
MVAARGLRVMGAAAATAWAVASATVMTAASPAAAAESGVRPVWLHTHGRFAPPKALIPSDALTYNQQMVPAGAGISVREFAARRSTLVSLRVDGLRPGHSYGAHVHSKPCGAVPEDSGPNYQDRADPRQPSTDPLYANARNEVWLDLTTNGKGNGAALSRHTWRFRPGEARSVVIHERRTATGIGEAGDAGERLACFTVMFERPGWYRAGGAR